MGAATVVLVALVDVDAAVGELVEEEPGLAEALVAPSNIKE